MFTRTLREMKASGYSVIDLKSKSTAYDIRPENDGR